MRGWKAEPPVGQRDAMEYENDDRAAGDGPVFKNGVLARFAERHPFTTTQPSQQPPAPWQHLAGPLGRLVREIARRSGFDVEEAGW